MEVEGLALESTEVENPLGYMPELGVHRSRCGNGCSRSNPGPTTGVVAVMWRLPDVQKSCDWVEDGLADYGSILEKKRLIGTVPN